MDSKQKNILLASFKVAISAGAAVLAWLSNIIIWFLSSPPDNHDTNHEFEVLVEDGVLKTKGGGHEATMDLMQGEEPS